MKNNFKRPLFAFGLSSLLIGILISLSSFNNSSLNYSDSSTGGGTQTCWETLQSPCVFTSTTVTVGFQSTSSYTITTGTTPGSWKITAFGQSYETSKMKQVGSNTWVSSDGTNITISTASTTNGKYTVNCNTKTSPGGGSCQEADCNGAILGANHVCGSPSTN